MRQTEGIYHIVHGGSPGARLVPGRGSTGPRQSAGIVSMVFAKPILSMTCDEQPAFPARAIDDNARPEVVRGA